MFVVFSSCVAPLLVVRVTDVGAMPRAGAAEEAVVYAPFRVCDGVVRVELDTFRDSVGTRQDMVASNRQPLAV